MAGKQISGMLPTPLSHNVCSQGHTKLPDYVSVGQFPKTPLRDLFTAATPDCLNLLSKCLVYDPKRRISAKDVRVYRIHVIGPDPSATGSLSSLLLLNAIPFPSFEIT